MPPSNTTRHRYHADLARQSSLRAAAAESAALKDRLSEASASAAALAASNEGLRRQLNASNAALAAAEERSRQLQGAVGVQQVLTEVVRDGENGWW